MRGCLPLSCRIDALKVLAQIKLAPNRDEHHLQRAFNTQHTTRQRRILSVMLSYMRIPTSLFRSHHRYGEMATALSRSEATFSPALGVSRPIVRTWNSATRAAINAGNLDVWPWPTWIHALRDLISPEEIPRTLSITHAARWCESLVQSSSCLPISLQLDSL